MTLKRYNQFKINESATDKIGQLIGEISTEFLSDLKPVLDFAQEINDVLQGFEDDGFDYDFDTFSVPSDYEGNETKLLMLNIDFQKNEILFDEDEIFWDFTLKELEWFMFDIENKEITLFVKFLRSGKEWEIEQLNSFEDRVRTMNSKAITHKSASTWRRRDRGSWGPDDWTQYIKFKISDLK